MTTSRNTRFVGCLAAAALLLLAGSAQGIAAQAGTYLEMETDSGGEVQVIKMSLGSGRLRMDIGQEMSLISIGGDNGKMLMIQHAEKSYLEFPAEMMEMMAGMMGGMPPQMEEEMGDMTPPTFTRTGNTKQVGQWNAYEVLVQHPEQDGDLTMWFSPDVDADFRALAQQVMDSMSSLLNSPMLGGMGGGGGAAGVIGQIQAQMTATNMPDGFPVQIVSNAGGSQSTNTLLAIDQGASFGVDTWEPPAGYAKMDMPFIR
jgi:hypothetical protein